MNNKTNIWDLALPNSEEGIRQRDKIRAKWDKQWAKEDKKIKDKNRINKL